MTECTMVPELIGTTTNLMLKPEGCSGPRGAMQGSHYTQTPQIVGAMPRSCFTGFEREYAKYMFNVIVEEDCIVRKIFERRALVFNAESVLEKVIFVELRDAARTISCIQVPLFESNHQYFGFSYILTNLGKNIAPGQQLRKGQVIAECPSVIDKEYCNGVQANVILVSHPQVIEDACVISDKLADDLLAYGYKTHRLFIGEKNVPLLPYGDAENPRMFPHIGEKVRDDGILFGTRPFDPLLAAVECSARALREPCTQFDDCVIVDKEAEVFDIKVYRDDTRVYKREEDGNERPHSKMFTPSGIQAMLDAYYDGTSLYHADIRDYWRQLDKVRGSGSKASKSRVPLTPLAHQQFLTSIAIYPEDLAPGTIKRRQFNKDLMDDYVVEITIKYPIPMAVSGKLTDCAGGKGIAGETRPRHEMPYDDFGNYVDIMMADNAVLRRTNFNRPFESYVNAASRDVRIAVVDMFNEGREKDAWSHLMAYCWTASPEWARKLEMAHKSDERRRGMLQELADGARLRMWFPAMCEKGMAETERDIEANFPPRRSPLTFTLADGTKVRTEAEFIVGELYIIRLDKTGRESFSISAGRYQQFGTIAKQHSADKYRRPLREQPIKFMGEAECRMLGSYTPEGTTAEIHDRSNNPVVMDSILRNMITHETPSNIDAAVDREKLPLGNNRTMMIANHVLECEGVKFTTRKGNITTDTVKFDLDL